MDDNMRETHLKWFDLVQRMPIYATIEKIDWLEVTRTYMGKGRPKKLG